MKKLLTVSLFAIMAVSAANADIASTKYVDDAKAGAIATAASDATAKANAAQTAAEAKVTELDSSLSEVAKTGAYADLTGTPTVDSTFSATSDNAATSKAIAGYVNGIKNELSNGNTTAVRGLQEQIDALDDDYVSETEIASYTNTDGMNAAIATAKSEAIADAAEAAKIYIDAAELDASQAAQNTTLQQYADGKASAAQSAAETAAANALNTYKTSNDAAVAAAKKAGDDAQADLNSYKTTNDAAVAEAKKAGTDASAALNAYKTEAATTFMDSDEVSAAIATAVTGDNGALKDYVTTEALEESQTAQNTTLQQYADGKASAAQSAAETAAEAKVTALADGAVKTNTTHITTITTNLGGLNGVEIPVACATGRCALVMENGAAKWETINY